MVQVASHEGGTARLLFRLTRGRVQFVVLALLCQVTSRLGGRGANATHFILDYPSSRGQWVATRRTCCSSIKSQPQMSQMYINADPDRVGGRNSFFFYDVCIFLLDAF